MGFRGVGGLLAEAVLDAVYPPLCSLCGLASSTSICPSCWAQFTPWEPPRAKLEQDAGLDEAYQIFRYEGLAPHSVQLLKYQRWTHLGDALSEALAAFAAERSWFGADLIAPIPIHWFRGQHRGFNQAELLCHAVPQDKLDLNLVKRTRWTRAQAKLDKEAREKNLESAFQASHRAEGKTVLLIDDVFTTGTTAIHCARALKKAGASKVVALMLTGRGDPLMESASPRKLS